MHSLVYSEYGLMLTASINFDFEFMSTHRRNDIKEIFKSDFLSFEMSF